MKPSTSALPGLLFPDPQQKKAASLEILLLFVCKTVPLDPSYVPRYADQYPGDAVPEANRNGSKLCCQVTDYYTQTTCRSKKPRWELGGLTCDRKHLLQHFSC